MLSGIKGLKAIYIKYIPNALHVRYTRAIRRPSSIIHLALFCKLNCILATAVVVVVGDGDGDGACAGAGAECVKT